MILQLSSNELHERIERRLREQGREPAWLDADPPTWNFPDDTPPHVMAGLRRLFSRPSVFDR